MRAMDVLRPERHAAIAAAIRDERSVIARGLGRSYGDAALNGGGAVILSERLDRLLDFDPATGFLRAESGVTIGELLRVFVPRGFLPPVVPGTKHVTLGGAVACDVHGKNHHVAGSIGRHVTELAVITADGATVRCSRTSHADLFRATIGGMGLTGFIVEVSLALRPVVSAYVAVDTDRARGLDEVLSLFEGDAGYEHSVAWIDCLARGRALGRSVLLRGNPLSVSELPRSRGALSVGGAARLRVPVDLPGALLAPAVMRAFNAGYYRLHPTRRHAVSHYEPFFFPLDGVRDWNRLYGARGFLQYQCALPLRTGPAALVRILELISAARRGSFLAVLKRFGPVEADALLSFPMPGYTLAVDFPRHAGVLPLLDRLDDLVAREGGRVYLAKDARLRPAHLDAMYPELGRWRAIRDAYDPDRRFSSDLSRRLGLTA